MKEAAASSHGSTDDEKQVEASGSAEGSSDDEKQASLICARDVKYHRDRDFLVKYGWSRVINPKNSKVVYQHKEGRWSDQPSVKAARRAMRAFFDERRNSTRRTPDQEGFKRRRGAVDGVEDNDGASHKKVAAVVAGATPRRPPSLPPPPPPQPPPLAIVECVSIRAENQFPAPAAEPPENAELPAAVATVSSLELSGARDNQAAIVAQPLLASVVKPLGRRDTQEQPLELLDKQQRRKQKNREAAATSRRRQQEHMQQLEEDNKRLREENAYLKKLAGHLQESGVDAPAVANNAGLIEY